ncbi:hypothetical protein PV341_07875 [Streptomyces sp. PA03-1a]|nr:hypothetical protein [Streptomyces sp. PA03-1a]
MPVEPVPCAPGGDVTPVEVTTCCAPSIASAALCRADGSTVLLVVRSGCVECGEAAPDPEAVGWIDAATGLFTAGPPPADAGPCESGCADIVPRDLCDDTDGDGQADTEYSELWCVRADGTAELLLTYQGDPSTPYVPISPVPCAGECIDTVCRQRCDDTDGDGQADATYSELWCIHEDGSAELVLTYQDDPSVPYVPTAPIDCTYGCPESETVTLCDDTGPFLRRYSFLNGTATYEDVALDGQTPHVVIGTAGVCAGTADPGTSDCASPTTPAATLGLCLADGTPIAVLITRDCDGATTQDGWLNLTTGTYSAGAPPVGAQACGDSRAFELAGLLCDVDPGTGDVLGLVLVEYEYNPDGSLASVRLVDPATGNTYTLQGDLTVCPGGAAANAADQDLTVLCDVQPDGSSVPFVRDFRRDPASGAVTGHTDYGLDGAPYTVTGTVGVCSPAGPDEQCVPLTLGEVCYAPAVTSGTLDIGTTVDGTWEQASQAGTPPVADPNALTWGPAGPTPYNAGFGPITGQQRPGLITGLSGSVAGWHYLRKTFTTSAIVTEISVSARADDAPHRIWLDGALLTDYSAVPGSPDINDPITYWYAWAPVRTFTVALPAGSHTLTLEYDNNIPTVAWGALDARLTLATAGESARAQVVQGRDGTTTLVDIETGQTVPDTAVIVTCPCGCADDGGSGTCSNASTLLLCDLPDDVDPDGEPAATDTAQQFIADIPNGDFIARPGGGAALWSGGTITFAADVSTNPGTITQVHRYVAATLQADAPACNAGTAHLSLSVDVENLGPGVGCSGAGRFRLFHTDGSVLAAGTGLINTPVGVPQTLTVEADVPAAALAAGDVAIWLDVETFQTATCPPPDGKQWEARNFTAAYAYDVDGCGTQFLRTVTTDCTTGAVTAVTDTDLAGAPYTVTGEVGQCAATGGGTIVPQICARTEALTLCDTAAGGTVTPFLRTLTYDCDGALTSSADTALDGATTYTPTGTVGVCPASVEEPGVDVELLPMCVVDNASGGIIQRILAEVRYDTETGDRLSVNYVDPITWGPVALPGGTHLDVCPEEQPEPSPDVAVIPLCDLVDGAEPVPFLRHLVYLPGADTPTVLDTGLDGVTPYAPVGLVGVCPPGDDGEDCTNGTTVLLCDQPAGGSGPVTAAITDATSADVGQTQFTNLPGPYTALWSGGSLVYPAGTGPNQEHAQATGRITAVAPAGCETSGGTLTVSVRVTQNGPGTGQAWDGALRLFRGTTLLDFDDALTYAPPGWTKTLTVSAPVTAADLTSGNLFVGLPLETFHGTAKQWTADQFSATVQLTDCASNESIQFLRTIVTDCETGAVVATSDTTLDGDPYTVTGDVGQCAAAGGDEEECCDTDSTLTLCDVADDGTSTPFLRRLTYTPGIATPTVADFALDGTTPYTVAGTVGVCSPAAEPCRNSSSLLLCDLPTDGDPAPTVTDTPGGPYYPYTTGVAMPGAQTLWDGGTLVFPDAAGPQPGTGGTVRTAAAVIQAPRPVCDAGTAHVTVQVDVTQLGPDNGCRNSGFLGLYNGPGEAGRVALALAPLDTPAGWSGTLTAEADVPAADLAAGNIVVLVAFDAYDDSGATCPPPRRTAWQLSAFTATTAYDQTGCDTQFLRTVTVDCETGTVTAVTDTTLDGQPYTLTGEAGQCTPTGSGGTVVEPCGDTEVVQLCDLTYDPQAPIPTPAGDFTLTGNVVAANNGTTLWFAQANQPANGVAELTVSGLLPATLYEFRFASAWIGAGGSDPVGNAAIYRLDVLDGATVLATRTRNVSNGSNVFPGGVLSEDMPPLAFIAPATGAVTIRFTDQTTGGPINDRDLFLMPFEVRTAVLTVTRTPFLRRFTFDCDGGLTSTQDLGLDGTTPYVVEGEAGQCAADGTTAGSVTPCDVQNVLERCRCDDTDGDGVADTEYLELLGVDCDGTLTSLGTYTQDLTAPYTPVAPVDCDEAAGGADPAQGVQARRIELTPGATWDAAGYAALQSVTAVAHGDSATITTADGTSTLHVTESATWSVAREPDAALTGPLTITAGTGTVSITFTSGVTL